MNWLTDFKTYHSVIVIVGSEYSKEGHIFRYQMEDEWTLMLSGSIKAGLVPNVKAVHKDIVFECTVGPKDAIVLYCVHSGRNKNSYITRFEFDFSNNGIAIKNERVVAYLNNINNLKPIKVDFEGYLVAIMARNSNPLKDAPNHNSYLKDHYVCLVYKLPLDMYESTEALDDVHVYKILTTEDFGVKIDADLSNLDPKFFIAKDESIKLGVNVGADKKSLKVFNMDPLTLIAPSGFGSNGEATDLFEIRSLSSTGTVVKSDAIYKRQKPNQLRRREVQFS